MRLRLAPLINNPQPSPRYIGGTVIGTVLTGGIAIMGTIGHTAITGTTTVRIGAAGLGIGRIAITDTHRPYRYYGYYHRPYRYYGYLDRPYWRGYGWHRRYWRRW